MSTLATSKTTQEWLAAHCRQQKQRFGGDEAALSKPHLQNQRADNHFGQTTVCFNLALHLNFADLPPIYAKTRRHLERATGISPMKCSQ